MDKFSEHWITEPLIHIGFPKALSSWMQSHLFQTRNGFVQLMGPFDVYPYFIKPACFAFNPQNIHRLLAERFSRLEAADNLIPVISSESLSGNLFCGGYDAKELADRLGDTFPGGRILMVIREQKSMIRSLYKSHIYWGGPHTIERMLNPVIPSMVPQFRYEYLEYDGIVQYYQDKFGKNNILVLPYESFKNDPESFIASIYEYSHGMSAWTDRRSTLPYSIKTNKGAPMLHLKLLRLYNLLFVSNSFNHLAMFTENNDFLMKRMRIYKKIAKYIPEFTSNWFEADINKYIAEQTHGKFKASNQKLMAITGLDLKKHDYEI